MKKIKLYLAALTFGLLANSCGDFGDINEDPNNPSLPNTGYMFTYACFYVPNFVMVGTYNPWNQMFPAYIAEPTNLQYGTFSVGPSFATSNYYLYMIKSLETIIKLNTDEETKDQSYVLAFGSNRNQIAVARTLRAFGYMHLTDILGMIPYSEAMKGDSDENFTPAFDTQESIYEDLDRELTEAYEQFDTGGKLGDSEILYKGDIAKWKKLNASVRMMLAIKLSDVAPETGKQRFAAAYNQDHGITNISDDLKYYYVKEEDNENILYSNIIRKGREDFSPCSTIIDKLKEFNDPRLKEYAVPNPNANGEYFGMPLGIDATELNKYTDTRCAFHPQFYEQDTPFIVISAARMLLIQAEAAVRGWINADAEQLYRAGIQASFDEFGITESVDTYLNQPGVKLEGDTAAKIEAIGIQRWLNGFMQDGIEAWSDWRRLDVPKLHVGDATKLIIDHVPYRLEYAVADYDYNKENFQKVLSEQGENTRSTRVWWDVADNEK